MSQQQETPHYFMSSNEEIIRLSYNHEIMKDGLGGNLILAPINFSSAPLTVLDSGTADGLWLRDFACLAASPSTGVAHKFIGTDINPSDFPKDVQSNFEYQIQDFNKPWPLEWTARFDLVHQRLGLTSSGARSKEIVAAMCKLVKPGGWIQLEEAVMTMDDKEAGPAWHGKMQLIRDVFNVVSGGVEFADEMAAWLRDFGFENVEERIVEFKYGMKNEKEELRNFGVEHTRLTVKALAAGAKQLGLQNFSLSEQEIDRVVADAPAEAEEKGHSFWMRIVWGQKKA